MEDLTVDLFIRLRQTPFAPGDRDVLTAAGPWLTGSIGYPSLAEFPGLPADPGQDYIPLIGTLSAWLSWQTHLQHWLGCPVPVTELGTIRNAAALYGTEAQRVLGSLFPLDHPFWHTYYQRTCTARANQGGQPRKAYATFLLPVDAVFALSLPAYTFEYEMLTQSLFLALDYVYGSSSGKHEIQQALRMASRLNMPACEAWLGQITQRH